jgi:integrase/recombinase XerD
MAHSVALVPAQADSGANLMQLYDFAGRRKYLTPGERQAFLLAAERVPADVRTFCETLGFTGCRLSEALALTAARVDIAAGVLVFESLKKRRRGIFRAVPVPPAFLDRLAKVHDLAGVGDGRLWNWSRTTGWRRVRQVMVAASIGGLCASPKGVRHGFGIKAVTSEIPLNMAQKWMGHARLATTAIYTDAVGPEEQKIAARMWAA